ncbi:MAG: hypothetical protein ACRDSL_04425 [Pseudonocardiaceae bacterium]
MATSVESTIRPLAIDDRDRELDWRAGLTALALPSVSSSISADGGLLPGKTNAEATSTGTAPAPKTTVAPYRVLVPSTTNYGWIGVVPASTQVDHTAPHATLPRIDLVVARIGSGSLFTETVAGTAASSPTAPSPPADSEVLWEARVNADGTVVYTSRRRWTVAVGGVRPLSGTDRNGVYVGEFRVDPVTGRTDVWNGAAWVPTSSPATYSSFTPTLVYEGGGGGTVSMGTGASAQCRYIALGKTLQLHYMFSWGTPPYNGGTGYVRTTLPPGYTSSLLGDQRLLCHLWARSPGDPNTAPASDWNGSAYIWPNTNILRPQFTKSASNAAMGNYIIALTAGVANQGPSWRPPPPIRSPPP